MFAASDRLMPAAVAPEFPSCQVLHRSSKHGSMGEVLCTTRCACGSNG
jgi:hypothetical protein